MKFGVDIGGNHIGVALISDNFTIKEKREKDLLELDKTNIKNRLIEIIKQYIQNILDSQKLNINNIEAICIAYPAPLINGKMGLATNLKVYGYELRRRSKTIFSNTYNI